MQSYLLFLMHQNLGHWLRKHLSALQKQNFRNQAGVWCCCGTRERTSAGSNWVFLSAENWVFILPGLQAPDQKSWFFFIRCTDTSRFLWSWSLRPLHSREVYDSWRPSLIWAGGFLVLRMFFYWCESCFNQCLYRGDNEWNHCWCLDCKIWDCTQNYKRWDWDGGIKVNRFAKKWSRVPFIRARNKNSFWRTSSTLFYKSWGNEKSSQKILSWARVFWSDRRTNKRN